MPLLNFHSGRVKDPGLYSTCRTIQITNGVTALYCRRKDNSKWQIQTYRFDKTKFSTAQAKAWLKENDINYILFEPASKSKKDAGGDDMVEDPGNEISFQFVRKDKKQHIISGIILVPDEIDADEEFANAEEIEKASISYMTRLCQSYAGSTIAHQERLHLGEQLVLIENYIAPVDLKFKDSEVVKKGTWIQSYKIIDADLWDMVESGELKGFSIGAELVKTPVED